MSCTFETSIIWRDQSYYYAISRTSETPFQTELESIINSKSPLELINYASCCELPILPWHCHSADYLLRPKGSNIIIETHFTHSERKDFCNFYRNYSDVKKKKKKKKTCLIPLFSADKRHSKYLGTLYDVLYPDLCDGVLPLSSLFQRRKLPRIYCVLLYNTPTVILTLRKGEI